MIRNYFKVLTPFLIGTVVGSGLMYQAIANNWLPQLSGRSSVMKFLDSKLDQDELLLVNGAVVRGFISKETEDSLEIRIDSGVVQFNRAEIKEVKRNIYTRYVTKLI